MTGLKIIISHDIDHWRWTDHFGKDLILPKHVARTLRHGLSGNIGLSTFIRRFEWIWRRQQHRLGELLAFNAAHDVPATYFVGVSNGLGLSYSLETSSAIVRWLDERGCPSVGVHGIAYDDSEDITRERERFIDIVGHSKFGIRMHYLRRNESTLVQLSNAGYTFDSSVYGPSAPYCVGGMFEFPIGLMDVRLLTAGRNDLDQVKETTRALVERAALDEIGYFTFNFHDTYFADSYPDHRDWYEWLVPWLRDQGYEFCTFDWAIESLRSESQKADSVTQETPSSECEPMSTASGSP